MLCSARQAKQDIFPHAQVGKQHRFLRDQIDTKLMRLIRLKARKRLAANEKFTAVWRFHPGDNFH